MHFHPSVLFYFVVLPIIAFSLFSFVLAYEVVMYFYTEKIRKISVREIMSE